MKKIYLLIFLILFANCGKPNYPKIDASFERFDTSLLKYIDNHGNFLSDGSYVEVGETSKGGYFYYKAPKNSYYRIVKEYYPNGNIAQKSITLDTHRGDFGKSYFFTEDGKLEKIEDHDLIWSFTINKVLAFLRKRGVRIPKNSTKNAPITITRFLNYETGPVWFIEWEKADLKTEIFVLDAKTGKLLRHGYGEWSFGDRIN